MKTGAWLRGGRGKIAGMVAQKSSDGKGTVLRELVTPSNPQTVDQMATRLAFGTVTQAAAIMLPIIGQTFKGQPDEKMNRRRFVALNTPLLKNNAIKEANTNEVSASFRAKSSSSVIPNGYIVSEGSLALPVAVTPTVTAVSSTELITAPRFSSFQLVPGESYNPANILASIFGIRVEQQLSVVAIVATSGDNVEYVQNGTGDFVRNSYMSAYRIVLNPNATPFVYTADMQQDDVADALLLGFDAEKTSSIIIDKFSSLVEVNAGAQILVDDNIMFAFNLVIPDTDYIVAMASIISEKTDAGWDYSTSRLVCATPTGEMNTSNNRWCGLTFNDALIDYLGAEAASKLFTRKGGTKNIII